MKPMALAALNPITDPGQISVRPSRWPRWLQALFSRLQSPAVRAARRYIAQIFSWRG